MRTADQAHFARLAQPFTASECPYVAYTTIDGIVPSSFFFEHNRVISIDNPTLNSADEICDFYLMLSHEVEMRQFSLSQTNHADQMNAAVEATYPG